MYVHQLKLVQLSKADLAARQMNFLRGGGDTCRCGCAYEDYGGSTIQQNSNANLGYGYGSTAGGGVQCSKPNPNTAMGGYIAADTEN